MIGTEGTTLIMWIIRKVMIITLSTHYDETSKHLADIPNYVILNLVAQILEIFIG